MFILLFFFSISHLFCFWAIFSSEKTRIKKNQFKPGMFASASGVVIATCCDWLSCFRFKLILCFNDASGGFGCRNKVNCWVWWLVLTGPLQPACSDFVLCILFSFFPSVLQRLALTCIRLWHCRRFLPPLRSKFGHSVCVQRFEVAIC